MFITPEKLKMKGIMNAIAFLTKATRMMRWLDNSGKRCREEKRRRETYRLDNNQMRRLHSVAKSGDRPIPISYWRENVDEKQSMTHCTVRLKTVHGNQIQLVQTLTNHDDSYKEDAFTQLLGDSLYLKCSLR